MGTLRGHKGHITAMLALPQEGSGDLNYKSTYLGGVVREVVLEQR